MDRTQKVLDEVRAGLQHAKATAEKVRSKGINRTYWTGYMSAMDDALELVDRVTPDLWVEDPT